jgi:hypothetical protein
MVQITNELKSTDSEYTDSILAKVLLGNSCSSKVSLRDINFLRLCSIGNDVT